MKPPPMTTADDGDAATGRDEGEVVIQVHVGEHLEDDVGALAVGQRRNLIEIAIGSMVHRVRRSLRAHNGQSLVRAGGADHGRAGRHGKLRRGTTYAAAGAMDEHPIAGSRIRAAKQRPPGRHVRHEQARALRERNAIG